MADQPLPEQWAPDTINKSQMYVRGSHVNRDYMWLLITPSLDRAQEWMAARGLVRRECTILLTTTINAVYGFVNTPPERVVFFDGWEYGAHADAVAAMVDNMLEVYGATYADTMRVSG
jgi:hypothetical protein